MRYSVVMLVVFYICAAALPASAQTYPPTIAGLRALVADDARMLPPVYAAKLHKEETDWEKGVGVTCRTYNPPLGKVCFPDARAMIEAIQSHVIESNGYIFYSDSWSATFPIAPADQADLGILMPVVLKQDIPQIVSPVTSQARVFNMAVRQFALSQWAAQGGPPRTDPHQDKSEDFELDYTIAPNPLPGVVSVSFELGWDTKTGAHGNFSNADFNWNLSAGRELTVSDVFETDKPWQTALDSSADAAFTKIRGAPFPPTEDDNLYDSSPFPTGPQPDDIHQGYHDPHEWRVTAAGLTIDTQEGEVCGYDCGMPAATIPWSALKSDLKPGGLVHNS